MMRFGALLALALSCVAQNDDPQAWMARGLDAFKGQRYAEAAKDFEQALVINPESVRARQYLATSYAVQYIPGANTPDNAAFLEKARTNFAKLLALDPRNRTAIEYLAKLSMEDASGATSPADKTAKLDRAREWYRKLTDLEPQNKEAFEKLGEIDWQEAYPQWSKARADAGLKTDDEGPIPNEAARNELRTRIGPLCDDGIRELTHALDIDPGYADALRYMNLLLREKADLAASRDEYERAIRDAEGLSQKVREAREASPANP